MEKTVDVSQGELIPNEYLFSFEDLFLLVSGQVVSATEEFRKHIRPTNKGREAQGMYMFALSIYHYLAEYKKLRESETINY